MNKLLLLFTLIPCLAFAQTTLIPDANFEWQLINLGYDTGTPDGSVPTANIDTVRYLYISGNGGPSMPSISDLSGIEDFTALTHLFCDSNIITTLDLSNNLQLEVLSCYLNFINTLDLSNNSKLNYVAVGDSSWGGNPLTCLNLKNGNNHNLTLFAYLTPNLNCVEVDNANWSTVYWTNTGSNATYNEDCNNPCSSTTGIQELPSKDKELLYITDILGRTTLPTPNTLLFYIYDDGSVEKKIQLER